MTLTIKVISFIFFFILLAIFQVIYDWATVPMDFIDETFGNMAEWTKEVLPSGMFTDLIWKFISSIYEGNKL